MRCLEYPEWASAIKARPQKWRWKKLSGWADRYQGIDTLLASRSEMQLWWKHCNVYLWIINNVRMFLHMFELEFYLSRLKYYQPSCIIVYCLHTDIFVNEAWRTCYLRDWWTEQGFIVQLHVYLEKVIVINRRLSGSTVANAFAKSYRAISLCLKCVQLRLDPRWG